MLDPLTAANLVGPFHLQGKAQYRHLLKSKVLHDRSPIPHEYATPLDQLLLGLSPVAQSQTLHLDIGPLYPWSDRNGRTHSPGERAPDCLFHLGRRKCTDDHSGPTIPEGAVYLQYVASQLQRHCPTAD